MNTIEFLKQEHAARITDMENQIRCAFYFYASFFGEGGGGVE